MARLVVVFGILLAFAAVSDRAYGQQFECADYITQPAAQAALERDPSDPNGLDPDGDGIACEDLPGGDPEETTGAEDGGSTGGTAFELPETVTRATIEEHIDGDKLRVRIDGNVEDVRLLGIDAPELDEGRYGECYAAEAADRMEELIPEGSTVHLERDTDDEDNRGRLLRFLFFLEDDGDIRLVNEMMLRDGYAGASSDDTYGKYEEELAAALEAAQEGDSGLWGACSELHVEITPTPEIPTPTPTFDEVVVSHTPLADVRELAIRPGNLIGERISFSGTVLSINVATPDRVFVLGDDDERGFAVQMQVTVLAPDGTTEVVFVGYDGDTTGIFEGTWVTVFGTVVGTQSFENALGGGVTQPLVAAELVVIG